MKWYKFDIRDLTPADYKKYYALMSKDKQLRIDRFQFEGDKKRSVAGEMLARKAIAQWCSIVPESIVFGVSKYGKPYAKDLPVEFSISHSKDMVVCAVDKTPIGIDVEYIRPIDLTVAKHICTDEELLRFLGHTPTAQDLTYTTSPEVLTRFFELWTRKEACGKRIGNGITCVETLSIERCYIYHIEDYIIAISK